MPCYSTNHDDTNSNILLIKKCARWGLNFAIIGLALVTPPALLINMAFQLSSITAIGLLVGIPCIGLSAIIALAIMPVVLLAMMPVVLWLAIGLTCATALAGVIAPWLGTTLIGLGAVLELIAVAVGIYECIRHRENSEIEVTAQHYVPAQGECLVEVTAYPIP